MIGSLFKSEGENARKFAVQIKEIANKMIVCNLHRFLQFLLFEVFYGAKFYKKASKVVDLKWLKADLGY